MSIAPAVFIPENKNSAVKKASKALKVRQDNTYSDEEIDSYLPVALRKNK